MPPYHHCGGIKSKIGLDCLHSFSASFSDLLKILQFYSVPHDAVFGLIVQQNVYSKVPNIRKWVMISNSNYLKSGIWIFEFWHFPPICILLKLTCLVTLFDCKLFINSPQWTIFGIFNELLSTQNVNVARFNRNVEWDLFCDFQTPCIFWDFFTKIEKSIMDKSFWDESCGKNNHHQR